MNNPAPQYLSHLPEKKLIFLNTYLPEYISTFKKYISELQACIDYNFYKNQSTENKVEELQNFFVKLFSTLSVDKITINETKTLSSGQKKLSTDFIIFWISEFNKLSLKIQNNILNNLSNIKVNEISNSIGHTTHKYNIADTNTSPYYDYTTEYMQLNAPIGTSLLNKISKNNLKTLLSLEFKTNIILKHNIKSVQSPNVKTIESVHIKSGVGYNTIAHGDNLVTDVESNYITFRMVDDLNAMLAENLGVMYRVVKFFSDSNNIINNYKIDDLKFASIDNEGQNLKIDLYQNVIK